LSDRKFKLDLPAQRRRHIDPDRYVVFVLWLIGYTERSIAIVLSMRTKQVAGLIARSDYSNRSAMTDQERRTLLQELQDIRMDDGAPLDGGRLNKISWELLPLGKAQLRGPVKRKMQCRH
jgi:hypothetical protein